MCLDTDGNVALHFVHFLKLFFISLKCVICTHFVPVFQTYALLEYKKYVPNVEFMFIVPPLLDVPSSN